MAERRARPPSLLYSTVVRRLEQVTPRLLRVTVGGDDLAGFIDTGTDQQVKLYFYDDVSVLPRPLTLDLARSLRPEVAPVMRSYTVRRFRPADEEMDIDFVQHGGVAAGWAEAARVGDELVLVGPAPGYRPDADVDTHLLIGDETALPAVAATLETLAPQADAVVVIEVADAAEEQVLHSDARLRVRWLHRDRSGGEGLADAVRGLTLPGTMHAWVAAEAAVAREIRRHLAGDRQVPRGLVHSTAYWRVGATGS